MAHPSLLQFDEVARRRLPPSMNPVDPTRHAAALCGDPLQSKSRACRGS